MTKMKKIRTGGFDSLPRSVDHCGRGSRGDGSKKRPPGNQSGGTSSGRRGRTRSEGAAIEDAPRHVESRTILRQATPRLADVAGDVLGLFQ